ncbi:MAG TPA: M23 family peptidase [Spirochaetaceae bacterium]|jgi:murein DD-endopeptidase MepM/ murein hydrolase activator NlpD|nr:M23 family peptidase [Spirochaetaceae bacterium]
MKARRRRIRHEDSLLSHVSPRWLLHVAAVFVFGFTFLGSNAVFSPKAQSNMGAADFSEFTGAEFSDGLSLVDEEAPPDEGLHYLVYKVLKGDTVSQIAEIYGVTVDSIVTFNRITNTRALSIGKYLKIPSMNGILYDVKATDSVESIAQAYKISGERILEVNELSGDALTAGRSLFLPDARLSSLTLREINGDLFRWPLRGWITSWYGWRNDPFTGSRSFHTGLDIGAAHGQTVVAAMEGVVSAVGYSTVAGNYIMLSHHSGYSTMYAHLSSTLVKTGQRVNQSAPIGRVGNTGYSTGPHLHFTVNKHGRTINPMTVLN